MPVAANVTYDDFELLVGEQQPGGYPATVVQSPAGETSELCPIDPLDPQLRDAVSAVANGHADEEFVRDLGIWLFDTLFAGDLAHLFHASLAVVRTQGRRLRLRLRLEAPELAHLPWECLYDGRERLALATSAEIGLVRHVPMKLPVRAVEVTPPLRILALMSSPHDMPAIDVTRERFLLEEALAASIEARQTQLQVLARGQLDQLGDAIRRFQPHIFHFVGHGAFVDDTAYLAFEDEGGAAHLVDEVAVRDLFSGADALRLAVLNACQSATRSTSQPLAGLAPRLLQRNLAGVVAMQFPIAEQAALCFTREFYRALSAGLPLEAAVSEARQAIQAAQGLGGTAWVTPVLSLRARNGQLFNLKETAQALPALTPPPAPETPPTPAHFVGRHQELDIYTNALATNGIVAITGMPGVGKTALAATLADRSGHPGCIFWHTFHPGTGVEALTWRLAAFLAWQDKPHIWQLLQTTAQNGGQPPPPTLLLDYVFAALQGTGTLLCLDDFHVVEQDPLAEPLLARLRQAVQPEGVRLILTSRHALILTPGQQPAALQGLLPGDARQLLAQRGLHLATPLTTELHKVTEGNAELLILAASALAMSRDPGLLVRQLAAAQDIERYLLDEVDRHLDESQKAVMGGVAALLGYPGTRSAIEELLDGANARRTLAYLYNRNLLQVSEGLVDREYSEHAIVQAFYYGLLSRRERMAMHRRAGAYYEFEEVDDLRAATHYLFAGDAARAAQVATRDLWAQVNQGRAQAIQTLLAQLPLAELPAPTQAQVLEAQGDLYHFLGDLAEALLCYTQAVGLTASENDGRTAFTGILLRKAGEVLTRQGDYEQAATRFQQAHSHLNTGETPEELARLRLAEGTLQTLTGAFTAAHDATAALLADDRNALPPRLASDAHDLLGKIAFYQGELAEAEQHYARALAQRQVLGDVRDLLRTHSNLAAVYGEQGRSQDALRANQAALALAEEIGDVIAAAHIEANLACDLVQQHEFDQARTWLARAEARYRHMGSLAGRQQVANNLAELDLQTGDLVQAAAHAQAALALAEELGEPLARLNSLATLAVIEHQAGRPEAALAACRAAQALATATDLDLWPELLQLIEEIAPAAQNAAGVVDDDRRKMGEPGYE